MSCVTRRRIFIAQNCVSGRHGPPLPFLDGHTDEAMTPGRVLSAALLWLALGTLGLLALTNRGPVVARVPGVMALVVPAIPIYFLATRFETARSHEGALWVSVHGPPFL